MSVAEKFTYIGASEGLPLCLKKIDVSGWAAVNAMSIDQFFRLYWLLEGVTRDGIFYDFKTIDHNTTTYSLVRRAKPKERICGGVTALFRRYETGIPDTGLNWNGELAINGYAFYNGPTSDENNLIGYGKAYDLVNYQTQYWLKILHRNFGSGNSNYIYAQAVQAIHLNGSVDNVIIDGIPFVRYRSRPATDGEPTVALHFYS